MDVQRARRCGDEWLPSWSWLEGVTRQDETVEERVFFDCRGTKLSALHRTCGGALKTPAIMAHGGPGGDKHGPLGFFDALAEKLDAGLGLSILRFDFMGYGESGGTPLAMMLRSRAEELGRVPTLIVHGDADPCVPVAQAQMAYERFRAPKNLVIVPGGGHSLGRPAERAVVLTATLGWLKQHLPLET